MIDSYYFPFCFKLFNYYNLLSGFFFKGFFLNIFFSLNVFCLTRSVVVRHQNFYANPKAQETDGPRRGRPIDVRRRGSRLHLAIFIAHQRRLLITLQQCGFKPSNNHAAHPQDNKQ